VVRVRRRPRWEAATERYARAFGGITREARRLRRQSHERAAIAVKEGHLAQEITPVGVPSRSGEPTLVDADEGLRPDTTPEGLARLRPAVRRRRHHHRRNASQISDGAAALVITSLAKAEELGLTPIGGAGQLRHGRRSGHLAAHPAVPRHQARAGTHRQAGLRHRPVRVWNEAFAAVALASMRDLGITDDTVNVNGGAIALGHPIGASEPGGAHTRRRAAPPRCDARRGGIGAAEARPGRRRHRRARSKRRGLSGFDVAAAFEGTAERHLVGVLEVATNREAARDARHAHATRP